MMFTVNCFVFLMLSAVSFRPPSESEEMDTETSGGDCVTWLNQLEAKETQSALQYSLSVHTYARKAWERFT